MPTLTSPQLSRRGGAASRRTANPAQPLADAPPSGSPEACLTPPPARWPIPTDFLRTSPPLASPFRCALVAPGAPGAGLEAVAQPIAGPESQPRPAPFCHRWCPALWLSLTCPRRFVLCGLLSLTAGGRVSQSVRTGGSGGGENDAEPSRRRPDGGDGWRRRQERRQRRPTPA